jgi:hypothetical protein
MHFGLSRRGKGLWFLWEDLRTWRLQRVEISFRLQGSFWLSTKHFEAWEDLKVWYNCSCLRLLAVIEYMQFQATCSYRVNRVVG